VEEVRQLIQQIDSVSSAWSQEGFLPLRFLVAWVLRFGLDTKGAVGCTPFFTFAYLPNVAQSRNSHVTVFCKALCPQMNYFQFPNFPAKFASMLDRVIAVPSKLLTSVPLQQRRELGKLFPFRVPPTNLYIIPTTQLIRMMQEERKYEREHRGVIPPDFECSLDASVTETGQLRLGDTKLLRRARVTGLLSPSLTSLGSSRGLERLETTRCVGLPASVEYFTKAVIDGIEMVNGEVFGRKIASFHDTPYHVGENWEIDVDDEPLPIMQVVAEYHQLSSSELMRKLCGETDEKDEVDDAKAPVDDDEEQEDEEEVQVVSKQRKSSKRKKTSVQPSRRSSRRGK
jgi:hypothetical protein